MYSPSRSLHLNIHLSIPISGGGGGHTENDQKVRYDSKFRSSDSDLSAVWCVFPASLVHHTCHNHMPYIRSPLEDSRLFGPSPWKVLRHYL